MELKDIYAIFAFILIFKMVTSQKLRGRLPKIIEPEESGESVHEKVKVAPMHMPIQVPRPVPPDEPEKLIIDGPLPSDGEARR